MRTRSQTELTRASRRNNYRTSAQTREFVRQEQRERRAATRSELQRLQGLVNQQVLQLQQQLEQIDQLQQQNQVLQREVDNLKVSVNRLTTHRGDIQREQYIRALMGSRELCQRVTGCTPEQIQVLLTECSSSFDHLTQEGNERTIQHEKEGCVSNRDQVIIYLCWTRQYPTIIFLQSIFCIHESTIGRILKRVNTALLRVFHGSIKWPTDAEFDEIISNNTTVPPAFRNIVCRVDGTRFKIKRPVDNTLQRSVYSGKTKTHNVNVLVVTLNNKKPIYLSKSYAGRLNDQQMWNDSGLRERFIDKRYGIMGDKGFTFNRVCDSKPILGVVPTKRESKAQEPDPLVNVFNKEIHSERVSIEHYFHDIKIWRIFKGTFRHLTITGSNKINFDDILESIVSLNEWLKHH